LHDVRAAAVQSSMASIHDPNWRLSDAGQRGDVATIERLLAAGVNANVFEGSGRYTALQNAARGGHLACMATLLLAGARVDAARSHGATALMLAAGGGRTAAIDMLLTAGADVHRVDSMGRSALLYACHAGHTLAARVLLEAGARADVGDQHGRHAIHVVRDQPPCTHVGRTSAHTIGPPPFPPRRRSSAGAGIRTGRCERQPAARAAVALRTLVASPARCAGLLRRLVGAGGLTRTAGVA
jgi:ankyrin repeat protein